MENEELVVEPQVDTDVTPETVTPPTESVAELKARLEKEAEARRHVNARAQEAEKRAKEAEDRLRQLNQNPNGLAVEDYIDISTSLDGLDVREKAYLAEQHRLSGKSLRDIREGEDFQFWQSAYRTKMEKENALRPSTTQANEDRPRSLADRLKSASLQEQEEILRENNLYKEFRPRGDRTPIGVTRTR